MQRRALTGLLTIIMSLFIFCMPEQIEAAEEYELIIEDGIVTGYTGTPVNVVVPKGVKGIEDEAFGGCETLISVDLPSGLTSIGDCAFSDCKNLTSVEMPQNPVRCKKALYS